MTNVPPNKAFPIAHDNAPSDVYTQLQNHFEQEIQSIAPLRVASRPSSSVHHVRVQVARQEVDLWIKTLKGPSGIESWKARQTLRDAAISEYFLASPHRDPRFRVPSVVMSIPETGTIVTRHEPGNRLQDRLKTIPLVPWRPVFVGDLEEAFFRAGEWLRHFQVITQDFRPSQHETQEPVPVKTLAFLLEQAVMRLTEAQAQGTLDFSLADMKHLEKGASNLQVVAKSDRPNSIIHGDFYPGNLLSAKDSMTGLDLSSNGFGSPLLDVGYFVFQTETFFARRAFRSSLHKTLVREFLQGYGAPSSSDESWRHAPEFKAIRFALIASRILGFSGRGDANPLRQLERRKHARKLIQEAKNLVQA